MTKEKDYLTLDEVEEYTGIKKNSLYYYLKTLDIKTHKFTLDRRAYISLEDANRIKEVKETPWLAGEKAEKSSVSIADQEPIHPVTSNPIVDTPKKKVSQNRSTAPSDVTPVDLPHGTIKLWDFVHKYSLPDSSVGRWVEKGLKGEKLETTTRTRTNGRIQHYLTPEQQEKAIEILKRHGKLKS